MAANSEYAKLLKEYPAEVSKEQFYKIAHISKKTARYLLQTGLVPCSDSGKKTRRYTIRMKDIIKYMKDREAHPQRYKCPSDYSQLNRRQSNRTYQDLLDQLGCDPRSLTKLLLTFYQEKLVQQPDVLTTKDISSATGYTISIVHYWIRSGNLKAFPNGRKYFVPRPWLLTFLAGEAYWLIQHKSQEHLRDFEKIVGEADKTG